MGSTCPVCGWNGLPADWAPGCLEICHCCSTQFGLDDVPYDSEVCVRRVTPDGVVGPLSVEPNPSPLQTEQAMWHMLREAWVREGMPWRHGAPPDHWNPHEQLRNIGAGI